MSDVTADQQFIIDRCDVVANGCWIWRNCLGTDGYGKINRKGKHVKAHRFSYEVFNGAIPDNMVVRHKTCGCRHCVNPEHLETGTHLQNMKDMVADGKAVGANNLKGRPIMVNGTRYNTSKDAVNELGISRGSLQRRLFNGQEGYSYTI